MDDSSKCTGCKSCSIFDCACFDDYRKCPENHVCCNGVCCSLNDCKDCDVNDNCVSYCDPDKRCCDGLTCYDPSTQQCCGDGTGHLCNINEICCNGNCCDPDTQCCVNGECKDCCKDSTTGNIQPAYHLFKAWIANNYPQTVIKARDDQFENERWLDEMRIQIQNVLDGL